MYYDLIDYSDVYQDSEGDWIVNNQCTYAENIYISDEASDTEIIDYLVSIGYLTPAARRAVWISYNDPNVIEVCVYGTYKPICILIATN